MKKYDWIIVGGGIKGILAAYKLSNEGLKVALVEKSNNLGGVLSSLTHDDFFLDLGCHLFDNIDDQITKTMFTLSNNEMTSVNVKYKSKIFNRFSENFAVPDFTHKLITSQVVEEIKNLESIENNKKEEIDYKSFLKKKYGNQIYELLDKSIKKITRQDAINLSSDTDKLLPFDRIKIADEIETKKLKENKKFKDILASLPNQKMHYNTQFYKHRNFYPTNGGLLSFVNNAKKYLISNEVDIINSYNIDKVKMHGSKFGIINKDIELNANNIFWTSEIKYLEDVFGTENKISDYILNVPMIIFYFFLKAENITDYTYITDYDEDTYIYRTSSSGLYGNQIINGNSFICVEVPTDLNSTIWADTEKFTRKIWQEVLHLGQAKGIMPKKIKIIKTPFSYKPLKYGYLEKFKKLDEELCDKYAGLKFTNPSLYSKVSIAKEIENIL